MLKRYIILILFLSQLSYGFIGDLLTKKTQTSTPSADRIELISTKNQTTTANTLTVEVNGMVCAFCAQGIAKNLTKHSSVKNVTVDLDNKIVIISLLKNQQIPSATITTIINDAGYSVNNINYE